jgi:hypothetical protein
VGHSSQKCVQEPGTWYSVLPLEWVYMFDPCCKTGQLDMRFVDHVAMHQDPAMEAAPSVDECALQVCFRLSVLRMHA